MGDLGPVAYLGFQKGIGYRITGFKNGGVWWETPVGGRPGARGPSPP